MAHVTFSDVVSNGQVDVDGEREATCVATACKMFGAMWTADAEEVKLCDKSMTILCDMLAAGGAQFHGLHSSRRRSVDITRGHSTSGQGVE